MKIVAGYSGTPLATKLGIKAGVAIYLVNAPANYLAWVAPLPDGVRVASRLSGDTDLVHIFVSEKRVLATALRSFRSKLKSTAMLWVSWPKKAAKLPTDITEDTIRQVALPLGYVDIKVCAVTEIWSGLKLVVRKELRA